MEILCKVRAWQHKFSTECGTRLVWAADEFYLNAGRRVPRASAYEGFPQIENGVGLVRKFLDSRRVGNREQGIGNRREFLAPTVTRGSKVRHVSLVTGTLAAPLIRRWAESIGSEKLKIDVYPITNRLFGETVTVTGLIAGRDVIEQLRGKPLGDLLVIPSVALRDGAFLDDVTIGDIERELGVRVLVSPPTPSALIRLLRQELTTDD